MDKIVIKRRIGKFGPNRFHEVHLPDGQKCLVEVVGSGACKVHASVDREGRLGLPYRRMAWGITVSATGGGKWHYILSGAHKEAGYEPSTLRYEGFMKAMAIFVALWSKWFGPADWDQTAKQVAEALVTWNPRDFMSPKDPPDM